MDISCWGLWARGKQALALSRRSSKAEKRQQGTFGTTSLYTQHKAHLAVLSALTMIPESCLQHDIALKQKPFSKVVVCNWWQCT
jgi:hypothetical protein